MRSARGIGELNEPHFVENNHYQPERRFRCRYGGVARDRWRVAWAGQCFSGSELRSRNAFAAPKRLKLVASRSYAATRPRHDIVVA